MIYHETDIQTFTKDDINIYFSNNQLVTNFLNTNINEACELEIVDLSGRILLSKQIKPDEISKINVNIPAGIYICKIQNSSINFSQKIIKN